ncbi:MAG: discoidin domain-containing protein, partial [Anaerohalosphaera sp.]|nr:discoidin domain-containing protein [Anaerohalosphaera sp.]
GLYVSAWPFTMNDLESAEHINELVRRDITTLNLDYKQMGLGGDNSWGARPHPEYTLPASNPYSYSFVLRPFDASTEDAEELFKRKLPATASVSIERSDDGTVTLSCMTSDVRIYYTVDGTEPSESSKLYEAPFNLAKGGTVKARATKDGLLPSIVSLAKLEKLSIKVGWTVVYADSVEKGEGDKEHAVDGKSDTFWHTNWSSSKPKHPHEIQIDMGQKIEITGFTYLPRQDMPNGRIGEYEFYVSLDGKIWGDAVIKNKFSDNSALKKVKFPKPVKAKFIRLIALSETGGSEFTTVAEIDVITAK